MNNLKAIIFDFDGVILESVHIKTDAFLELFSTYPQHLNAIKTYHLENGGVSRFVKFRWIYKELLEESIDETQILALGERFSQLVFNKILSAPFVPGAIEFLNFCRDRFYCFIASGTPEDELRKIVTQRGLAEFFNEVKGTPTSKVNIVHELCGKYKINPTQCLFIGDATTDYQAARTTGTYFVARNTSEMESNWRSLQVSMVENLMEVVPLING